MRYMLRRRTGHILRRTWGILHPRVIAWRYVKRRQPGEAIITELGKNLKVRIYPHDVIGKDIYVNGVFERAETSFVMKHLQPGMVFFDVGANLGQYTLIGAQRVGITGQVHSFEPSNRMFGELQYNVGLNVFSDICTLNKMAVSDNEGTARLSVYEPGAEVYGSLGNQDWPHNKSVIGHEDVKTIALDTYVKARDIKHVDLIKIDIEGAELLAIRGACKLLNQPDAPTIVLEMADVNTDGFGYKATEIWDYLEDFGYRMYCFGKGGNIAGRAERPRDFTRAQNLVASKS